MAARPRRTLLAAFALSILIHLLAGPFVRERHVPEPVASTYPFAIDTATPKPPPPTPKPTPSPKPVATRPPESRSNPISPPRQSHHHPRAVDAPAPPVRPGDGGPGQGPRGDGAASNGTASSAPSPPAIPSPTPAPTVAPTAAPACTHPNVAASTIEAASVVSARVARTPSPLLNDAALRAARTSRFRTEVRDCQPVAAEYVFSVDFNTQ
jgi:hypothetical protein